MHNPGDVIVASVQYTDGNEIKVRPALVLFEEFGNIVVAGITSNLEMQGIPLTKNEGAVKDSVIKLNYLFTISEMLVKKKLFHLSAEKKRLVFSELEKKLNGLLV